ARGVERQAGDLRRGLTKIAVELADARGNAVAAEGSVQLDGGWNGQEMLVGEKTAGRDERGLRRRQRLALHPRGPRLALLGIERRDRRPQFGPDVLAAPEK